MLPMFKEVTKNNISYDLYERGINLPAYFDLQKKEIKYVANSIMEFLSK